jgi:hypothetical protein
MHLYFVRFAYTSDVRRLFCLRKVTLRFSVVNSRRSHPRCVLGDFAVSTEAHTGARRSLGAASVHRTSMMQNA